MGKPIDRRELRTFGLSLGGVCLIWAGFLYLRHEPGAAKWLVGIAPVLAAVALTVPVVLHPIHVVWMPVARAIAKALTWLLLTIVFVLVFTPYGLVARLLGKDSLDRKIDRDRASYWIRRQDGGFDRQRMTKQY
jgi:hypothetical protein